MSANTKLLIPKDFKFMGKDQQTLYKEAVGKKKDEATPAQTGGASTPKSFGNVVPLIGLDGKTEFTAMGALDEAKKQGKCLVSLKAADHYVIQNGQNGGDYWTGDLIAYANPGEMLGAELTYTCGGISYTLKIPQNFQNLTGETALILPYGKDPKNPNYEFIQEDTNLWTVKINNSSLIVRAALPRKNDWYETDAGLMLPNGAASDSSNKDARFLSQSAGAFFGLLARGLGWIVDGHRDVGASSPPSSRFKALVYE